MREGGWGIEEPNPAMLMPHKHTHTHHATRHKAKIRGGVVVREKEEAHKCEVVE